MSSESGPPLCQDCPGTSEGRVSPGAGFDPPRGVTTPALPPGWPTPRQLKPALGGNYKKSGIRMSLPVKVRARLLRVMAVEQAQRLAGPNRGAVRARHAPGEHVVGHPAIGGPGAAGRLLRLQELDEAVRADVPGQDQGRTGWLRVGARLGASMLAGQPQESRGALAVAQPARRFPHAACTAGSRASRAWCGRTSCTAGRRT